MTNTRQRYAQGDLIMQKRAFTICICTSGLCNSRLFCLHSPSLSKKKKRSQSKEGLTCCKRTRVRMHEACTHLLVSEPVGNCHMPGRFFNLARWCSAIRPTKSFNQSPVRHMKNLDLSWQFLLNQCACPLCIPLATFSKLSLFSLKPIPVPPCSWYGPNSFFVFPHFLQATITPLSLIIFLT